MLTDQSTGEEALPLHCKPHRKPHQCRWGDPANLESTRQHHKTDDTQGDTQL